MKTISNKRTSRWGLIAAIALILTFLVGGAIYAQNNLRPGFGRGHGPGGFLCGFGHNQPGEGFGPGMGPGEGMGPGPGGPGMGGPGMGGPGMGGGPEGIFGMQFLMQDDEIKQIMEQIHLMEGINGLNLTIEQVEGLKEFAIQAQDIVNSQFNDVKGQILESLESQLQAVASGEEIDMENIRTMIEGAREQVDPGAIKDQLDGILTEAIGLLDADQQEMLNSPPEDGMEHPMRERMQNWMNRDQGQDQGQDQWGGREWLNFLDDETRASVEEQIRAHMDDMRANAGKMKLMMMLLSPEAIDAMDTWLAAH